MKLLAWQKQGQPKQHGQDGGPTGRDIRIEVGLVHPVWEAGEEIQCSCVRKAESICNLHTLSFDSTPRAPGASFLLLFGFLKFNAIFFHAND